MYFCTQKQGMKKVLLFLVIILTIFSIVEYKQVEYANNKWKTAEANVKAYSSVLSGEKNKNTALQLTVSQLGYFKDSVLQELDNTRHQLNIKDKNLKALQSVSSGFSRTDTITVTQVDTLFREPSLSIDTVMGDKWYQLSLGLEYPSMITVKPYFKSEKHIVVSSKKETVNPPKKFFLFRWFQKKHVIIHVDVIEKNPYVSDENSRYVEIMN
jgi:hypothetical protein